ncbi:hypothetical protein EPR50_G00081530 [Perca flavescens]|uniref:Cytohesin Ubiquitin Protein Inducing domain-containing protein n=1 Tax=Perca flavescens TaxID=8167 RepID=A0A484D926_PERFV|nr:hypothetical protein EPR50_G00081530 [Perca flavescens]
MATGVNYWSSYEHSYKVSECVWGGEREASSEEEGGGATWDTHAMEVKGQLISAPDPFSCPDRKQRERMAELLERRRGLQALLSARLAELRRICLQEAELTGAVPSDFPLEAGEKPPCVRRRAGTSRPVNRKCRAEEEDSQRSKQKKTLFSGALRKHSDSEHNTQTHTHHGKRTVHRGCHTDDTVRSESSSTSDSTGLENDDGVSQCRPPLVSTGSPVEVFYQNKTRRNSLHNRANAARHSNSSYDGGLERTQLPEVDPRQAGLWVNGLAGSRGTNATAGAFRSSETLADGRTRAPAHNNGRAAAYGEVLLDYVWGKQQQLQRQQSQPNSNRQPITSQHHHQQPITSQHHQQLLYNSCSSKGQPQGAPPSYRGHSGDQRRVKVTRTKSCGPFLPPSAPAQEAQLEDATRSLHKALALEGLRDWYLRNTIGSTHQNRANGKVNTGVNTKANGGVKGQAGGGGALHGRRRTHGGIQQATYQTETSHHKKTLPHSATFHGHPLHGRSVESSLYQDSFPPQKQEDQLSPGTLV